MGAQLVGGPFIILLLPLLTGGIGPLPTEEGGGPLGPPNMGPLGPEALDTGGGPYMPGIGPELDDTGGPYILLGCP